MNSPCRVATKPTPKTAVLPAAFKTGNYELRSHAAVQRIKVSGNRATSVTYVDAHGREFEQPADIILLTAFTWSTTHQLLLSRLGTPYDPPTGPGGVCKNYARNAR